MFDHIYTQLALIPSVCTEATGRGQQYVKLSSVYLNLTEKDFIPDAVAANDSAADFSTFSLGSKVEQPTLQRGVRLVENLQRTPR